MFLTCHSSFGPALGHSFSKPVSCETPSRCGPRHCGQSSAREGSVVERVNVAHARDVSVGFVMFSFYALHSVSTNRKRFSETVDLKKECSGVETHREGDNLRQPQFSIFCPP